MEERQRGPKMRLEKTTNRSEVSNAWNFDFDDDESDGADVAAFEYADSSVMGEGTPLDNRSQGGNFGRPEYDLNKASREPRVQDREYSDADTRRPRIGFDDFDDEEDDIDNYELDTSNRSSVLKVSSNDFSEFEGYSGSEDSIESDKVSHSRHRTKSPSYDKQAKSIRRRAFSGSDDDDDDLDSDFESELSTSPKWKSSHVADSRPRGRGRGSTGPSKGLSFGSDDEAGLYSDMDDELNHKFGSRRGKATDFRRRRSSGFEDDDFAGLESEDGDLHTGRNGFRGKADSNRNGKGSKGQSNYNFTKDNKFKSSGMKNGRRNSFEDDDDDFDGSSKGYHGRGFKGKNSGASMSDRRGGDRQNFKGHRSGGLGKQQDCGDRQSFKGRRSGGLGKQQDGGDRQNFKGRRSGGFGKQQDGRRNAYDRDMDTDFDEFRNKRRVIER